VHICGSGLRRRVIALRPTHVRHQAGQEDRGGRWVVVGRPGAGRPREPYDDAALHPGQQRCQAARHGPDLSGSPRSPAARFSDGKPAARQRRSQSTPVSTPEMGRRSPALAGVNPGSSQGTNPPETGTIPNRSVYKPESDRGRVLFLHDSISCVATSDRRGWASGQLVPCCRCAARRSFLAAPPCFHVFAARSTQMSKKRFVLGAIRISFA